MIGSLAFDKEDPCNWVPHICVVCGGSNGFLINSRRMWRQQILVKDEISFMRSNSPLHSSLQNKTLEVSFDSPTQYLRVSYVDRFLCQRYKVAKVVEG